MVKNEQRFERRVQEILSWNPLLVVNCTSSYPFDLVVSKDQISIPIELKARGKEYGDRQKAFQIALAKESGTRFILLRQSENKGKMILEDPTEQFFPYSPIWENAKQAIKSALKQYLED